MALASIWIMQVWTNWARKTSETQPIFRACTDCLVKKEKPLDLQVFSQIGNNEKVTTNSKCYHEHQRNILIKFTYLTASKLAYPLMNWVTFK